jgi:hypothetical protein
MDLAELQAELAAGHPVTGPYSPHPTEAAAQLNAINRTRPRTAVTGSEVLNAIDKSEFLAQTEAERARVWNILHLGTLDPWGLEAELLVDIFGAGSATITALAALRTLAISRGTELGFGGVTPGHVERARAA